MLKKFKYKEVTWIDLESPTLDELDRLDQTYKLHPVALEELRDPSSRSKIDVYKDFLYLVLRLPRGLMGRATSERRDAIEIDLIVGKDFVLTAHYETLNALNDFAKIFETDFLLKKSHDKMHGGLLFFYIMREIYHSMGDGLDGLNEKLKNVGDQVFSGHERQVVKALADINYELTDSRWALKDHRSVLSSLELAGEDFFGAKFKYYLRALRSEHERILHTVKSNHATFLDLRETNDSLLSIKTNNVMRTLTVVAFILLPLDVILQLASIYAFPVFWPTIGLLLISVIITYTVARSKKWI
ncbi:MAG: CorA family divalent cation transporter [Patescibacteria group bacterium]|nr:CorA family divalent cation transporter [Patescibacteria group bacterium]